MSKNRLQHITRLWVYVAMVAFLGQAMSVSAHASAMMLEKTLEQKVEVSVKPSCHSSAPSDTLSTQKPSSDIDSSSNFGSCCDSDCSMFSCKATAALVNIFESVIAIFPPDQNYQIGSASLLVNAPSLYRPPILG